MSPSTLISVRVETCFLAACTKVLTTTIRASNAARKTSPALVNLQAQPHACRRRGAGEEHHALLIEPINPRDRPDYFLTRAVGQTCASSSTSITRRSSAAISSGALKSICHWHRAGLGDAAAEVLRLVSRDLDRARSLPFDRDCDQSARACSVLGAG